MSSFWQFFPFKLQFSGGLDLDRGNPRTRRHKTLTPRHHNLVTSQHKGQGTGEIALLTTSLQGHRIKMTTLSLQYDRKILMKNILVSHEHEK